MNNIFVAMKGSSSQASRAVEGLCGVVSENILANTADVNSIGVHLFSEKLLVANNHMSGVGLPFEMDGTDRSSQFDLLDNVAVDPPPAHATIGADLRANGCVINVRGNTVQGYVNGFVVRTNAFDLPKVEFTDNDVVATDACYRFRDATGAGRAIASLRIAGGKCSGTYLARWDDPAVTPEVTIEDVDVRDIGNGILFAGAVAWRNAHVRLLRGHTIVTTGATPENLAFFELAPGTIAQAEISAVGQAADGTAAISKKVIDAWRRAASSAPERVGPITTVRDAGTASPDALQLVRSGNGVLVQFKGIDGVTMSNRITFDVTIISAR